MNRHLNTADVKEWKSFTKYEIHFPTFIYEFLHESVRIYFMRQHEVLQINNLDMVFICKLSLPLNSSWVT